jgi:hypothetical protein
LPTDSEYPDAGLYYISPADAGAYPVRQGDLFPAIEVGEEKWSACQLVHPTCELAKASVKNVQVIRVRPFTALPDDHARARVAAGLEEVDGQIRVAYAHTFFLAPVSGTAHHDQPMFSDFRDVTLVDREGLLGMKRVAAMTHDLRLYFIRRKIYFRYRFRLGIDAVIDLERMRIRGDPDFVGPKPTWV